MFTVPTRLKGVSNPCYSTIYDQFTIVVVVIVIAVDLGTSVKTIDAHPSTCVHNAH